MDVATELGHFGTNLLVEILHHLKSFQNVFSHLREKFAPTKKVHAYGKSLHLTKKPPLADFSYIFSRENFWEDSAEKFPQKILGKNGIFLGKSFEKLFFQEIPLNFPREKINEKSAEGLEK
jgi:hypothetical protein